MVSLFFFLSPARASAHQFEGLCHGINSVDLVWFVRIKTCTRLKKKCYVAKLL